MNKEQLEQEHAHVKAVLAEVNDFINSEEFYKLPEKQKTIHTSKKIALETYINALSMELWGDENAKLDISAIFFAWIISSMVAPPNFCSGLPSVPTSEEKA